MGINSQYKSSVFSFLFSDLDALRELYEAVEGVPLPQDIPITLNTLEGVLYKNRLNDLSFLAGNKLVLLIEHQSTINPNMAVRLFMYLGRVYEQITADANLYGRKKLIIPRPECIVLYNGIDPYPDEGEINLSDAFAELDGLGLPGKPFALNLRVKVFNINEGRNPQMLSRSSTLKGYTIFVAKAREYETRLAGGRKPRRLSDDEKQTAMKEAVTWCIDHNILKSFLKIHGSEVVNMLFAEWKLEDALLVERAEGREEGLLTGKWEIARNLKAMGLPIEQIVQGTRLSREVIENL